MIKDVLNWMVAGFRIFSSPRTPRKAELILTYGRLRLKNLWLSLTGRKATTETIFGFKVNFFDYPTFTYLFEEIFVDQIYHFKANKRAPLILDCGSNIGMAVLYFKYLYPESRIKAFEPDPRIFAMLKKNVEENRLAHVELHNYALLDREGELEFFTDTAAPGSLISGLSARQRNTHPERVACRPLSPFVDGPGDFMKMDIEGAEADCLKEMSAARRLTQINQMIIECHHNIAVDRVLTRVLGALEENAFNYQVSAVLRAPYPAGTSQDVMVYAYPKTAPQN